MKLKFSNVCKIANRKNQTYELRDINASFNEFQSVAVWSVRESSSIALLNLVAGINQPTRGKILRDGLFTGPIGDSSYFHRELTGEENIRFICKIYGQNANQVIQKVKEFAELGKELKKKTKTYSPLLKRKIAISASLHIKSDIYQIIGGLDFPEPKLKTNIDDKLVELANQASLLIFTGNLLFANKYGNYSVVIDHNGYLQTFNDVQSGIDANKALKKTLKP